MKKWINFLIGIFIVAFSFNLFCVPNNLASSGIGGLSIVVGNFIDIDKSLFVGVVNIFLIIISYVFLLYLFYHKMFCEQQFFYLIYIYYIFFQLFYLK